MNSLKSKDTGTLILSRCAGEQIEIGSVLLTVTDVRDGLACLRLEGIVLGPVFTSLSCGSSLTIADVKIEIDRVSESKVRIVIVAPKSIKISRVERLTEVTS